MGKAANYIRGSLEERFWAKVARQGPTTCWEWQAALDTLDRTEARGVS